MDFSDFELTKDAVFVQLKHPKTNVLLFDNIEGTNDQDPDKPVGVKVYGADSDVFKKHRRQVTDKSIEARARRKNLSAAEIDNDAEKTLAACIAEFVNVSWQGKPLTAPNDAMLFVQKLPGFAEQIDEAMADRTLFMPALAKNS
jgi:hypothetical protein